MNYLALIVYPENNCVPVVGSQQQNNLNLMMHL